SPLSFWIRSPRQTLAQMPSGSPRSSAALHALPVLKPRTIRPSNRRCPASSTTSVYDARCPSRPRGGSRVAGCSLFLHFALEPRWPQVPEHWLLSRRQGGHQLPSSGRHKTFVRRLGGVRISAETARPDQA